MHLGLLRSSWMCLLQIIIRSKKAAICKILSKSITILGKRTLWIFYTTGHSMMKFISSMKSSRQLGDRTVNLWSFILTVSQFVNFIAVTVRYVYFKIISAQRLLPYSPSRRVARRLNRNVHTVITFTIQRKYKLFLAEFAQR